jgi:asparagine synthase (glutamine-hydrolysing)
MCSILGIFGIDSHAPDLRRTALDLSRRMRHRGPDWSGIWHNERAILAHERLAIVDVEHGAQPLISADNQVVLAVNGEIYNHQLLQKDFSDYEFQTTSDCEVILPLFQRHGADFLNSLNGIFAFALYDIEADRYLVARDPIGVMPLYYGHDREGRLLVASEMKALIDNCEDVTEFPPGSYLDSSTGSIERYYTPSWREYTAVQDKTIRPERLREALEHAVDRQLMTDVPYGVLLSGGLDSSVIAAIASRLAPRRIESEGKEAAWWPRVHSFAIGLQGSPDLAAARIAAEYLDTVHHTFEYTVQQGLDALSEVIYHLETYDVTTIRASTPMYLMARRIKATGVKMVLSGEGADEIFGGYLYFHKAPDAREFHAETVRKLDQLHSFDCLRANKSMAAWGVEARVPFLDREFLDVAMSFDASAKMIPEGGIEKRILREAFEGLLPNEILWRQKEQFSDGVGYSWIDSLRDTAGTEVTDEEMAAVAEHFPINPPFTKEGYFYRRIFEKHFPGEAAATCVPGGKSIACSTPTAIAWDEAFAKSADPSGRAVGGVHKAGYAPPRDG